MDLVEAEGLADLIDAETRAQMQQALRQMQGEVGAAYESLRGRIIHIMALLEAYIDFPDEDIPPHVVSQAGKEITSLITHIRGLLDDNHRAERLREGIEIVILGAPNAGKSTLLNALAKREVAIVSPIAGTTRDVLEVHLDLAGYPVTLIDTAGLHELEEKGDATRIEAEGMRRARDRAANAALVLELFATGTLPEHYSNSLGLEAKNYLLVRSKCDLASAKTSTEHHGEILAISAQNGEGIESLLQLLSQHIAQIYHAQEPSIITRTRHRTALTHCLKHLEQYQSLKPLELNAEHLRLGARELASITGHISVDHVLDVVFSSFCIGK
jgi:tRNA modification GTPase